MNVEECLFCKMALGQIPVEKIYEDDVVLSFLDIGPISDGHSLVIPKQHYEEIHNCPADVLAQVASEIGKIAGAIAAAMNADGYNVMSNNGRAAGQVIDHLHFHIIPRKAGDGIFNRWPSYKYKEGQIEKVAAQIRKKM
ncbi:MAG: HIT domain-containing protein [Sedimentisphaerales bacterium]|nr:HIT domain-containing protein [Sedimentisphaerales bacterium]